MVDLGYKSTHLVKLQLQKRSAVKWDELLRLVRTESTSTDRVLICFGVPYVLDSVRTCS